MSGLSIRNIYKTYGATRALAGVSFDVARYEIVAVLGPSGCGKSTLLHVVAGLESPDQGDVLWDGESLQDIPPHRRDFGLMFQDFALFPHRNVYDNVAFALQMARLPREKIRQRVAEVLELVGLPEYSERDVNTLSGGEQQRTALARALAPSPRLLMLDEPLGSLDRALRERLVVELRHILRRMDQTALYVTHDQEEAFALADRVVLMNAGRVEQIGPPQEIYTQPASLFVARFLGLTNLLPGRVVHQDGRRQVETSIGRLPLHQPAQEKVTILLRPDAVRLNGRGECSLTGEVVESSFRGAIFRTVIEVNDVTLSFNFPTNISMPAVGEQVQLAFDPEEAIQVFSDESLSDA